MSAQRPFRVLFLCTRNSARSIIAECVMNRLGRGRFVGLSAGTNPSGVVEPAVIELMRKLNYDTGRLRSKSWSEFSAPGAPGLDFVVSICDTAANESVPVWPGQPASAQWTLPDPLAGSGSETERRLALADVHRMLYQRIGIFVNLPTAELGRLALRDRLDRISAAMAHA